VSAVGMVGLLAHGLLTDLPNWATLNEGCTSMDLQHRHAITLNDNQEPRRVVLCYHQL